MANRIYPLLLISFTQTMEGDMDGQRKEVHSELEYDEFVRQHRLLGHGIREEVPEYIKVQREAEKLKIAEERAKLTFPLIAVAFKVDFDEPNGHGEEVSRKEVSNIQELNDFSLYHKGLGNLVDRQAIQPLTENEKKVLQLKSENEALQKRKLVLDVKTGERIYKTYFWTQGVAWIGGGIAIILGYLKIAETFHLFPYKK